MAWLGIRINCHAAMLIKSYLSCFGWYHHRGSVRHAHTLRSE